MEIGQLLATYPRNRPRLTQAHQEIYDYEYKLNRSGGTIFSLLATKTEGWMHRQVASRGSSGKVLEIGAGTLNHLPYESPQKLTVYDIIEPFETLYHDSLHKTRIRNIHRCITQVTNDETYDRIISIAVLEHLTDLPFVVANSALRLKEKGLFQHGIPSEGGFAWGLAWRLTTGLSFRLRTGLSYGTLMRHEHVNSAREIIAIIRHFFSSVRILRFPLPSHHLSLYSYLEARIPNEERCRSLLRTRGRVPSDNPAH